VIANILLKSLVSNVPGWLVAIITVLLGICQGLIYSANLVSAWSHYPDRKALATGVNASALVLGQFIYNLSVSNGTSVYDTSSVWAMNIDTFVTGSIWVWVI